jgi:hypothetical protein
MSTTSLPRRAGARAGAVALAALAATGTALLAAPSASAAPGDDGDISVRMESGSAANRSAEPEVCRFHLEATDFDVVQNLAWSVEAQPATRDVTAVTGTLSLVDGAGGTDEIMLPEGQYKLSWKVVGGLAPGKQKVVGIDCTAPTPAGGSGVPAAPSDPAAGPIADSGVPTAPSDPAAGPNGGPAAGGGGLAQQDQNLSPVTGAVAVALAAVGGTVYLRLRRRRPHGVA